MRKGTLLEQCGPYSYDRPKEEISGTVTGAAHDAIFHAGCCASNRTLVAPCVAIASGHIMQPHRRVAVALADLEQSNIEKLFAGEFQVI